jgi:hypothetical protein
MSNVDLTIDPVEAESGESSYRLPSPYDIEPTSPAPSPVQPVPTTAPPQPAVSGPVAISPSIQILSNDTPPFQSSPPAQPGIYSAQTPPQLQTAPVSSATQPVKKKSRVLPLTITVLVGLVIVSGATVAMAEMGYLPAVSLLYRKSGLETVWGGTQSRADLALAQVVTAAKSIQEIKISSTAKMTVRAKDASKSVTKYDIQRSFAQVNTLVGSLTGKEATLKLADGTQLLPWLTGGTAQIMASEPSSGSAALGLVSSTSSTTNPASPNFNPLTLLPFSISLTSEFGAQPQKYVGLTFSLDLNDLANKVGQAWVKILLPDFTGSVDGEIFASKDTGKAYGKLNVLPYLSSSDKGKWLWQTVPASYWDNADYTDPSKIWSSIQESYTDAQSIKPEDVAYIRNIMNGVTKDMGVTRLDSKPVAHYKISLDESTINQLGKLPSRKNAFDTLPDGEKVAIVADIFVDEFGHKLHKLQLSTTVSDTSSNVEVVNEETVNFAYAVTQKSAPAAKDLIQEEASSYLNKVGKNLFNSYFGKSATSTTTGTSSFTSTETMTTTDTEGNTSTATLNPLQANNTTRIAAINSWAAAMKSYLDQAGAVPPSTGNVVVHLDAANNPLTKLSFFSSKNLETSDPVATKYYYGYKSDGKSYEFSCITTDVSTGTTVTAVYKIKDGVATTTPSK